MCVVTMRGLERLRIRRREQNLASTFISAIWVSDSLVCAREGICSAHREHRESLGNWGVRGSFAGQIVSARRRSNKWPFRTLGIGLYFRLRWL